MLERPLEPSSTPAATRLRKRGGVKRSAELHSASAAPGVDNAMTFCVAAARVAALVKLFCALAQKTSVSDDTDASPQQLSHLDRE